MKLLHTADWHLGRVLNGYSLIEDQRYILRQILDLAEAEGCEALFLSGDIYDKSIPTEEAVRLFDDFIVDLRSRGILLLAISGNHDSDERLHFASRLLSRSGVYLAGRYDGELTRIVLEDAWGPVEFSLLPFIRASVVRHFHEEAEIANYEDAVRVALAGEGAPEDLRRVVLSHQFVMGNVPREGDEGAENAAEPEAAGSESVSPRFVGAVERVGCRVYADYDYAALGHIHSPQSVGLPQVRYAGSPLAYSASEAGTTKSVTLIELREKGSVDIRMIPLTPLRALRRIRGPLELLVEQGAKDRETGRNQDYIAATLTDAEPVRDALQRLRAVYPNLLEMDRAGRTEGYGELRPGQLSEDPAERSFEEVVGSFWEGQTGEAPDPEMWAVLRRAGRTAEVPGIGAEDDPAPGNATEDDRTPQNMTEDAHETH